MKIGELAQRTDSTIRQLRYYDEQGLLGSDLSDNNYCNYDEDTIEQVCQIKNLAEAGLPTRIVCELPPCLHAPPAKMPRRSDPKIGSLVKIRAQKTPGAY